METLNDQTRLQSEQYLNAWTALGNILRDGGSWSGHERNCCFLNTQGKTFVDASAAFGLDHLSDSRAIAMVDWDQDGKLDLWTANRTAPRVRLLRNVGSSSHRFVAIRLQGTQSNRDAIGARLELELLGEGRSMSVQTLRAGEGYLAQSSKWLHFGLGDAEVGKLRVKWPSGQQQDFADVAANTHYHIVEGGTLRPVEPVARRLESSEPSTPKKQALPTHRIIPHRRLPLPTIRLVDENERLFSLDNTSSRYTLVTLWATWCQPCRGELVELDTRSNELSKHGIFWLPVNVDDFDQKSAAQRMPLARALLAKLNVTAPVVLGTRQAVECLDVVQRVLVTKQSPLPVPCSFLLDEAGRLMAVYKGTVGTDQLIADLQQLTRATEDPRDVAIPFPGSWGTNVFPPDLLAIPVELTRIDRWSDALEYLVRYVPTTDLQPPIEPAQLAEMYMDIGKQLAQQGDLAKSELAFQQCLRVDPGRWTARTGLAEVYLRMDKADQAIKQYRLTLQDVPGQPMSLNNLAWLLATCPNASLRNPTEAVRLAKQLCQKTNFAEPVSLDTLSVALAADGEFAQAIEIVEKAIALTKAASRSTAKMEYRLSLFRKRQPYLEGGAGQGTRF